MKKLFIFIKMWYNKTRIAPEMVNTIIWKGVEGFCLRICDA